MRKLIGFMSPFKWIIVIIFLLLLGQALCDLTLPDYMSKIVNVGIQQHGITDPAPNAIRASEMDRLLLFVDADGKKAIQDDYQLLSQDRLSGQALSEALAKYPVLAKQAVYERKEISSAEIKKLNLIFARSLTIVSAIETQGLQGLPNGQTLPDGTDPFQFLASLPENQLAAMRQIVDQQTAALPDSILNQTAISYLSTEYKTIGLNISKLQTNYLFKIGGLMLLLTLLGTALSILVGYLAAPHCGHVRPGNPPQTIHQS